MLRALARLPFLAVRQLRWRKGAWSKDSDRQYHEQLYEAQDYDAFRASYPGYVTIRRFADHAEVLMPAAGAVLDIGCGPGEITCELARRHPHLSFLGIDHSARRSERATRNAARLGLDEYPVPGRAARKICPRTERYGLVLMFDAFHHLEQPREFLTWLRARTSRVVLIEPAGTWTGRWARNLDVDWLLDDLANIRDRLEALCGADAITRIRRAASAQSAAARRRHRCRVKARSSGVMRSMISRTSSAAGQLRITGTIAGFDRYPPGRARGERAASGDGRSRLRARARDRRRAARAGPRWRGEALGDRRDDGNRRARTAAARPHEGRRAAARNAAITRRERVRRALRAIRRPDGSRRPARSFARPSSIVNAGWDEWRSDGAHPVHVSYHWLKSNGGMVEFDGLRTRSTARARPGRDRAKSR